MEISLSWVWIFIPDTNKNMKFRYKQLDMVNSFLLRLGDIIGFALLFILEIFFIIDILRKLKFIENISWKRVEKIFHFIITEYIYLFFGGVGDKQHIVDYTEPATSVRYDHKRPMKRTRGIVVCVGLFIQTVHCENDHCRLEETVWIIKMKVKILCKFLL